MNPKRIFPALLLLTFSLTNAACQSAQLNTKAATAKQAALAQPLQQLAAEQPDTAAAVNDVLNNWATRSESQTYTLVAPLIDRFTAAHPDRKPSLDVVMRNWKARIDKFETP